MKKRICAIMLSIMMMIMIVPTVFAAESDVTLKIVPDKTTAKAGDIVTFTVSVNSSKTFYTLQFELGEMSGLELVNRGAAADGVKAALGFDNFAWADDTSLTVNGFGATPKTISGDLVLGTFQCKVVETKGEVSAKLYNVEFTDENYDAITASVNSTAVKVEEDKPDPVESKPDPVESKPDPVESKPDPVESKADPVESKVDPVESKADPVESKPADSKVDNSKPAESKADSSAAATSSTKPATTSSKAAANNSTKNPNTGSAAPVAMAAIALVGAAAIVVKKKKD